MRLSHPTRRRNRSTRWNLAISSLQLLPDVGVEVVGVDGALVLHAVAEAGVHQLDAEALASAARCGRRHDGMQAVTEMSKGIEVAVALGHVGGDGVAADAVVRLEQPEVEPVGAVVQRERGPQPRDAPRR